MKRSRFLFFCWIVLCFSFNVGCNLLDSDPRKEPLLFEKMEIEYVKYGGWINKHKLLIDSSGVANAKVIAHAGSEVLRDTTTTLTADQQELLSTSFASFARYERHYQPKKDATDGNHHQIVLIYDGAPDTVSAYMPHLTEAPESFLKLINDLEQLHQSILESDNQFAI